MTFDLELGLNYGDCDDCENDWGLFVVLDEEEKKQISYRKMLLKNIIQIETIEEGECEYETEETYGNKIEYYRNAAINGYRYRYRYRDQSKSEEDQDQDRLENGYGYGYKDQDRLENGYGYGYGYKDQTKSEEDRDRDRDRDQAKIEEDQDQEDYKNIVKDKIQFLITYMFTASISMALIILTFTI